MPALRALRAAFPRHRLVLAAPAALAPLAALTGAVDEVLDTAGLAPLPPPPASPDVAVNLHGRGPQSHRLLLGTAPRRLVAFAHPAIPQAAGLPRWRAAEHEVHRWCRLLTDCGVPADPNRLDLPAPPVPAPRVAANTTVIHPGTRYGARRWPAERFAAVARDLHDRGEPVVVTGGAGEVPLARAVAAGAGLPATAVLAGRTDLLGLAGVVAAARRVVCADTGVAHLATAYRTPSVVLFGPVPPARWGPPPDRPRHRVLWAGQVGDGTVNDPFPGLLAISVQDVLTAVVDSTR